MGPDWSELLSEGRRDKIVAELERVTDAEKSI